MSDIVGLRVVSWSMVSDARYCLASGPRCILAIADVLGSSILSRRSELTGRRV